MDFIYIDTNFCLGSLESGWTYNKKKTIRGVGRRLAGHVLLWSVRFAGLTSGRQHGNEHYWLPGLCGRRTNAIYQRWSPAGELIIKSLTDTIRRGNQAVLTWASRRGGRGGWWWWWWQWRQWRWAAAAGDSVHLMTYSWHKYILFMARMVCFIHDPHGVAWIMSS